MKTRITCPKCKHRMAANIFSKTLSQVLKCPDCQHKFTYDPQRQEKLRQKAEKEKDSGFSISNIVEKGIKDSVRVVTSPVKTARNEMHKIRKTVRDITGSGDEQAEKYDNRAIPERAKKEEPNNQPGEQEKKPVSKSMSRKRVTCPECNRSFNAGIPDNHKKILTTKCPDCSNIFTFQRPREQEETEEMPEPTERRQRSGSTELSCPKCSNIFKAGIPDNEKNKLTTQCPECSKIFTFQRPLIKEQTQFEGEKQPDKPDAIHPETGEPGFDRFLNETEKKIIHDRLQKPKKPGKAIKKEMININCPFCQESFDTKTPEKKTSVRCPICEEKFQINKDGEFVPKKLNKGILGLAARIFGDQRVHTAREAVRDAKEGISLLRNPREIHTKTENLSGKAGLLLIFVFILGVLYAGALAYSIPDLGEEEPEGNFALSGTVFTQNDTCENAVVNITDLGLQETTDSQGMFYFANVPAGEHEITVSSQGKGSLTVKLSLGERNIQDISLQIPEEGKKELDLRHERTERAEFTTGLLAAFVFIISLLALMAGLLALQGKRFNLTVFLSGISILSFGFFIGSVLALVSVVILLLGKKDFS